MCTPQSSRATAPARSRTLKVPCIGLRILCLEARRPASDLPNPIDVSNWVGRHAGAVIAIIVANKKGGPKAAPSPARFERPGTPQGVATLSPFKTGPKALQRAGCITMTLRINAVN
jgi:hypothetical protein